jgi:nitroimidazol reductase NimA-like FMN-containing flavoprotein (pyridoxamine 5'-phosphate oxidase superfamily)
MADNLPLMRRKDREVTDRKEIEEIISQCKTTHVAMVDNGAPYVVPLSHGYRFLDDDTLELYFHSAFEGKKTDILKKNNKVCFEMSVEGEPLFADTPCKSGYYYASVIGFGEVVFIEEPNEKREALSTMYKHQSGREVSFTADQASHVCVFKIVSSDYSGKKKPKPNV